jgi:hypothetical protein
MNTLLNAERADGFNIGHAENNKTRNDVTIPTGGNNGKRPLPRPNPNWVVIHRNGRLSPTVNGQTRCRLHQISVREFDALPRKRQAAIVAEEYRRGTPLVGNSELTISRTTTEHFGLKKGVKKLIH